jgi:hypothetical protein
MRSLCICLTAVISLAGCATETIEPPIVQQACQARDDANCIAFAYAGERVELKILGQNFAKAWVVDLGTDQAPAPQDRFRAWFDSVELQSVEPDPDPLRGKSVLLASQPGQVPVGQPLLTVESPAGQSASLAGAFEIRTPLLATLEFEKPVLPRGDVNRLTVILSNRAAVTLEVVALVLSQGGSGSYSIPSMPAPFEIPANASVTRELDLEAASPGQPELVLSVTALADGRIPVSLEVPARLDSAILEEAQLQARARFEPEQVAQGDPVSLIVEVSNQGGVASLDVNLADLTPWGAGEVSWDQDPGTSRDLAPQTSYSFRRSGVAETAGTLWLQPQVQAEEILSGRALGAATPHPISLEIQP